jgi:hypothetical protein
VADRRERRDRSSHVEARMRDTSSQREVPGDPGNTTMVKRSSPASLFHWTKPRSPVDSGLTFFSETVRCESSHSMPESPPQDAEPRWVARTAISR